MADVVSLDAFRQGEGVVLLNAPPPDVPVDYKILGDGTVLLEMTVRDEDNLEYSYTVEVSLRQLEMIASMTMDAGRLSMERHSKW